MKPSISPEKLEAITPQPYFKIRFGCSNRAFYDVLNDLRKIAKEIGIELEDGYISKSCDQDGDLDRITIYRGGREEKLAQAVLKFYGVKDEVPEDMDIHLTIF